MQDLLNVKKINTKDNSSDTLTKSLGKTLFYRHIDTILGYRRPQYKSIEYSHPTIYKSFDQHDHRHIDQGGVL